MKIRLKGLNYGVLFIQAEGRSGKSYVRGYGTAVATEINKASVDEATGKAYNNLMQRLGKSRVWADKARVVKS